MAEDDPDLGGAKKVDRSELKGTAYELFIATLSILSIVNIVLILVMRDDHLDTVVKAMNVLLSIIFLGDFGYRLFTAESKRRYFVRRAGWADLLASIPVPQLKVFRLVRLLRVKRLMDREGGTRVLRSLIADRAESALLTLLLLGILVLQFGSLLILRIEEKATDSNIHSASDAIWYVLVTISTVGYGDRFPVTTWGRVLGGVIIVIGVGIFGTFTGFLANVFLTPRKKVTDTDEGPDADDARSQIDQLRELMVQQQATINQLEQILNSPNQGNPPNPAS
jgi:voltage-gated potassium channel